MHVEVVHSDPDGAAAYVRDVLGGKEVEKRTSALVETFMPGMRCIHMMVGSIVFQFIKPGEGMHSWQEQLDREGPSVHNIAYTVADIERLRTVLLERGSKIVAEFNDCDMRPAGIEGDLFTMLMIDAREQIGVRLELLGAESGWPSTGEAP
jgi:hypothetical protein